MIYLVEACIRWDHSKRAGHEALDMSSAGRGMAGLLVGLAGSGLGRRVPMGVDFLSRNLVPVCDEHVRYKPVIIISRNPPGLIKFLDLRFDF
jgi:hypothetical protein